MNHQKLKSLIESLLIQEPRCRDDVPMLYMYVVKELGVSYQTQYGMLTAVNYSSVHRLKNMVQKKNVELRGTGYIERKKKQEEVRKQYSPTYWDRLMWWNR